MVMEAYENVKNFRKKYYVNHAFSTKTIHRIIIIEENISKLLTSSASLE